VPIGSHRSTNRRHQFGNPRGAIDNPFSRARLHIVKDEIDVVDFGDHALKGRVGNVRLYGVIGLKGSDRQIYDQVHNDLKRHTTVIDILKGEPLPPLG
jgi:hypothetical protein